GNLTGLSTFRPELSGKRLELLKEAIPKLSRVAVFGTSTTLESTPGLGESELAAGVLKVQLRYLGLLCPTELDTAFSAPVKEREYAVLWVVSGALTSKRTRIADMAVKSRLPVIYELPSWVEAGGLMSYGVNLADLDGRAAWYVDKILKGMRPADLPVEQPKKLEFVINLKAAKQIGVTIPPNVLARADKVIR